MNRQTIIYFNFLMSVNTIYSISKILIRLNVQKIEFYYYCLTYIKLMYQTNKTK